LLFEGMRTITEVEWAACLCSTREFQGSNPGCSQDILIEVIRGFTYSLQESSGEVSEITPLSFFIAYHPISNFFPSLLIDFVHPEEF
jgi:hypothetical protein